MWLIELVARVYFWLADRRRNRAAEKLAALPLDPRSKVQREIAALSRLGGRTRDRHEADERPAALNPLGNKVQDGPRSSKLIFEYADSDGVVTKRRVSQWIEYRRHFQGYCSHRKEQRTFRKDRVLDWIDGEQHFLG